MEVGGEHFENKKCEIKIEVEDETGCDDQWLKESSDRPEDSASLPWIKVEKIEPAEDEEDNFSTYSGYYDDVDDGSEDDRTYEPQDDEESEVEDEEYEPRRQRRKVNFNNNSLKAKGDIKKVTKMALEKLCETAQVTDLVGSQCKYECLAKNCNRSFRSWGSLNHHFRTDLTHGPAAEIQKHLTCALCHKCHICGEKVLADRGFLNIHMQSKHNMTLETYCKRCKKKEGGRYMTKQDSMKDILSQCTGCTRIPQTNH